MVLIVPLVKYICEHVQGTVVRRTCSQIYFDFQFQKVYNPLLVNIIHCPHRRSLTVDGSVGLKWNSEFMNRLCLVFQSFLSAYAGAHFQDKKLWRFSELITNFYLLNVRDIWSTMTKFTSLIVEYVVFYEWWRRMTEYCIFFSVQRSAFDVSFLINSAWRTSPWTNLNVKGMLNVLWLS